MKGPRIDDNPLSSTPSFFFVFPMFSRSSHSWRSLMLLLSRKPGEKVVIDGDITITVVEINGGRVKIGIEAPAHVAILRSELVAGREATCLSDRSEAKTVRLLERNVNGGQVGADHGRSDLQPEPITAVAIKDPLRRLRKIP